MTRRAFSLLALCLVLAACGSERDRPLLDMALEKIEGLGQNQPPPPTAAQIREGLTPEVLAQLGGAVLLVELPRWDLAAGLVPIGRNRGHLTWGTTDGVNLSFRDGMMVSTRGLGFDLMAADVGAALDAVKAGRGQAVRIHRYLDGENRTISLRLICEYGREDGGATTETCDVGGRSIENRYWLDPAGSLRKSRQWHGPQHGHLHFEFLP